MNAVIRDRFGGDWGAFERELAQRGQSLEQFRTLRRENMIVAVMKARVTKGMTDPAAKERAIDDWLMKLRASR